jgi:hypothetical protein
MAERSSLKELVDEIEHVLKEKDSELSSLNDLAYRNFRKIILFRDRNIEDEMSRLEKLEVQTHAFIEKLTGKLPDLIQKLTYNHEISAESKTTYKSRLLSTRGVNELLGLVEAIGLELTRNESFEQENESVNKIAQLVERVKKLSGDLKNFIQKLQDGIEVLPPAALYTVEGKTIGVALIMVYSFLVAFNSSFVRLTQKEYEGKMLGNEEKESETVLGLTAQEYIDIFLPLLGIPGYIVMHYLSTRISLKYSFSLSIILLIGGNLIYYLGEYFHSHKDSIPWIGNPGLWCYLIGKGIIVSRLPLYGVKQFIGYLVEPEQRIKLSTCSVAAIFMGYSCGYFLALTSVGYEGEFLVFTTNQNNVGGLFIGSFWIIIFFFCSVLFVEPDQKFRSEGHKNLSIQVLTIISYTLPFAVMQIFVSNHARPKFEEDWNDTKFFTFLGIFCLLALPVHLFVYISSYFTSDKTLISFYKLMIIIAGPLYILSKHSNVSQEFWYVVGSLMIVMGVNMGMGVSFAMLAGNIRNHRIGLFAGVLEVIGVVIGNFGAEMKDSYEYFQIGIIVAVLITFVFDLIWYNDFNPTKINPENHPVEENKKNN